MALVHSLPSRYFVTGFKVDKQSFTWRIEGYPTIRKYGSLINPQRIDFTGEYHTTGQRSRWTVFLRENGKDGKRWIGIYLKLNSPNPNEANIKTSYADIRFTIKNKEGEMIKDTGTSLRQIGTEFVGKDHSWGFPEFIDADDGDFCPEEDLVIQISFELCTPIYESKSESDLALEGIVAEFQAKFSDQLRKDLTGLILMKDPIPFNDIRKIISNDKKEFTMLRGILAVRSDVFAAMLSSNMTEGNCGVIELSDISSKALQVLLAFLYTAELDPEWTESEVLVELTNAAAKYQLSDLLQFLDATLGKVCKLENVLELFELARQLSLKTAEEELYEYYFSVRHILRPESIYELLRMLCSPGPESPPLHHLIERKSGYLTILTKPLKTLFAKVCKMLRQYEMI